MNTIRSPFRLSLLVLIAAAGCQPSTMDAPQPKPQAEVSQSQPPDQLEPAAASTSRPVIEKGFTSDSVEVLAVADPLKIVLDVGDGEYDNTCVWIGTDRRVIYDFKEGADLHKESMNLAGMQEPRRAEFGISSQVVEQFRRLLLDLEYGKWPNEDRPDGVPTGLLLVQGYVNGDMLYCRQVSFDCRRDYAQKVLSFVMKQILEPNKAALAEAKPIPNGP